MIGYYDPKLHVRVENYPNHHWGYWTETLQATGGALFLRIRIERNDSVYVQEAIEITERDFPKDFWGEERKNLDALSFKASEPYRATVTCFLSPC
ncbi:MAG: hypothetical protein QM784_22495 [Polyangiaceae bacterium]